MAQLPRLLMDSLVEGTLPCAEKLPWLLLWFVLGFLLPHYFDLSDEVATGLNVLSVLILWKKL
jgi:hypothetical protein